MPPNEQENETSLFSDEVISDGKDMQEEIKRVLTEVRYIDRDWLGIII